MNFRIIITALLALAVGLGAGYLFFSRPDAGEGGRDQVETPVAAEKYTCSMHPQIRQEGPGRCPICEMELVPVAEAGAGDPLVLQMTPEAVKLAQIQTTTVGRTTDAKKTIALNGKVAIDERRIASQVAHLPGRIEKLFVSFTGESVQQGQPLLRLYSPEWITTQQELLSAKQLADTALLNAARRKARRWKLPDTLVNALLRTGRIRETFDVPAETAGVVVGRRIAVGDYVSRGAVLYDIADLSRVWVLFDAYEEDLATVQVGDRITFETPAIPGREFTARIRFIDPVIDEQTRIVSLRAEVANPGRQLKPAMLVRGVLESRTEGPPQGTLTVPKSAVLWTGKRSVVYVEAPGASVPSFEYREVLLGASLGDAYRVKNGLSPGDQVVTYGAFTIDAAAQLNNQASMMNREVTSPEGTSAPAFAAATPDAFRDPFNTLIMRYLAVKDALVATDPDAAAAAARSFLAALDEIDELVLPSKPRAFWLKQQKILRNEAGQIAETAEVEGQRRQFESVSEAMITTVRAFGGGPQTLYVQHCPMAFDDRGADWLSQELQIRNPYFGSRMLKCGVVEDSLGVN